MAKLIEAAIALASAGVFLYSVVYTMVMIAYAYHLSEEQSSYSDDMVIATIPFQIVADITFALQILLIYCTAITLESRNKKGYRGSIILCFMLVVTYAGMAAVSAMEFPKLLWEITVTAVLLSIVYSIIAVLHGAKQYDIAQAKKDALLFDV
jgi:hypothetical protein